MRLVNVKYSLPRSTVTVTGPGLVVSLNGCAERVVCISVELVARQLNFLYWTADPPIDSGKCHLPRVS